MPGSYFVFKTMNCSLWTHSKSLMPYSIQFINNYTFLLWTLPGPAFLLFFLSPTPSKHLVICHFPLLSSIFPRFRVFSNELALRIRWPKYWSFGFSISSSNEYSGLISFSIDWFDFLGKTLKSLLQYHNSKTSILQFSAFFMVKFISIHDY